MRSLALALMLMSCAAAPRRPEPVACTTTTDCELHPRECRLELAPACDTCAGLVSVCVARTAEDLIELDQQSCVERGGTYSDGMCVLGELRKPD